MTEIIAIASDHAGLELKRMLMPWLEHVGCTAEDLGTHDSASCDYPDFAHALSAWVLHEPGRRGILICGSGIGMSIAANRFKGIRAALCRSGLEADLSRRHNDANVLCLGGRITGIEMAKDCVKRFLTTPFEGGRHEKRVEKLDCAIG